LKLKQIRNLADDNLFCGLRVKPLPVSRVNAASSTSGHEITGKFAAVLRLVLRHLV